MVLVQHLLIQGSSPAAPKTTGQIPGEDLAIMNNDAIVTKVWC